MRKELDSIGFSPNSKGFYVYKGLSKRTGDLMYIGTTIQIPKDRFRWHKANGKSLNFSVIKICKDQDEMLDLEHKLIQQYKPRLNKITNRKQNFNKKLTQEDLNLRVGDSEWCQCCLKRRVNKGYSKCYYCGKVK